MNIKEILKLYPGVLDTCCIGAEPTGEAVKQERRIFNMVVPFFESTAYDIYVGGETRRMLTDHFIKRLSTDLVSVYEGLAVGPWSSYVDLSDCSDVLYPRLFREALSLFVDNEKLGWMIANEQMVHLLEIHHPFFRVSTPANAPIYYAGVVNKMSVYINTAWSEDLGYAKAIFGQTSAPDAGVHLTYSDPVITDNEFTCEYQFAVVRPSDTWFRENKHYGLGIKMPWL